MHLLTLLHFSGEIWELDSKGCCPQYVVKCTDNCPIPQCSEKYYKPNILEQQEQCCPHYVCGKLKN